MCVMEGGGPTQVRKGRGAGEQVMKELLMDSVPLLTQCQR